MHKYIFLFVLQLFLLVGCATKDVNRPPFNLLTIPEGKAVIYVYRPSSFAGGGGHPKMYINDKEVYPLFNASYQAFIVGPGANKVNLKGNPWTFALPDEKLVINAEAGQYYFAQYSVGLPHAFMVGSIAYVGHSSNFGGVAKETALNELRELDSAEELLRKRREKECREAIENNDILPKGCK